MKLSIIHTPWRDITLLEWGNLPGKPPGGYPGLAPGVANPHVTRQPCNHKLKYPTAAEASIGLAQTRRRIKTGSLKGWTKADLKRLRSYKCPHCTFWHLGKQQDNRSQTTPGHGLYNREIDRDDLD